MSWDYQLRNSTVFQLQISFLSPKDIYDPQNAISLFSSERSYATGYAAAFSIYKKQGLH
jgi:hypothetical protein